MAGRPPSRKPQVPRYQRWYRTERNSSDLRALGLPYAAAVTQTRETREQVQMESSRQQFLTVQGAFAIDREACSGQPVLLTHDTADSRWTLTEVGRGLRRAGVVAVWPLVPASAGLGG